MPIQFTEIINESDALNFLHNSLKIASLSPDEVAFELETLGALILEYERKDSLTQFEINGLIGMYIVQNTLYKIYNELLDELLEIDINNLFLNEEFKELSI